MGKYMFRGKKTPFSWDESYVLINKYRSIAN